MRRLVALREHLRTSLWFIPSLFALAALLGGLVLIELDRQLQVEGSAFYLYGGSPEGARSVLSTIAQSMLAFTGLVFTVTMLVLQLASSQLSPRVLRTFLADRNNQVVLGLFVATFIFTLVVLRDVRSADGSEFVPAISVWVSFILLGASVAAFVYYINHMAHAIRATSVITSIAAETRSAIDRIYPAAGSDEGVAGSNGQAELQRTDSGRTVEATDGGYLVDADERSLVRHATEWRALIELVPAVGEFVAVGMPLFRVSGDDPGADRTGHDAVLRRSVTFGQERTMQQDAAFGFRQLVDVAARALSPGTNDPTTCIQAIDRLHELLLQLVDRPVPSSLVLDQAGALRLIARRAGWDLFVRLAVDELLYYGRDHVRVLERLESMLKSVAQRCPADRLAVVRVQMGLVEQRLAAKAAG